MKTKLLVSALLSATSAFAIRWNPANDSGLLWNDDANWNGGVKPGAGETAEFNWNNANKQSGTYIVGLGDSQEFGMFQISEWNNPPSPFYVGSDEDVAAGYTLSFQDLKRMDYMSGEFYFRIGIVLLGDATWSINKGYNGTVYMEGPISGPYGITVTYNKAHGGDSNPGTLYLNGENTYTGTTTLSSGTIYVGNGTSKTGVLPGLVDNSATLIMDPAPGGVTVLQDVVGTGSLQKRGLGTLVFAGTNSLTSTGSFTITPHVWSDYAVGPIDCVVPNGVASFTSQSWDYGPMFLGSENLDMGTGPITLKSYQGSTSSTVTVQDKMLTLGGVISGSLGLNKAGKGTLKLTAANLYTKETKVNAGTLLLEGEGTVGPAALTIGGDGVVILDNTAANADRIADSAAVSIGGGLHLLGNASEPTTEALGALTLATGPIDISVESATLSFTSLAARSAGSSGFFRIPQDSAVVFASGRPAATAYGAFAAIDGIGAADTTGAAVIRSMIYDGAFATIGTDGAVRALDTASEQSDAYADGTDNVRLDLTGNITLGAAALNTLELRNTSGSPVTVTLTGTLTAQNGILFSGDSAITLTGGAINANADAEAILLSVNTAGVTVATPVTGDNITVGGTGDMAFNGNLTAKTYANGYITVNNSGTLYWGQKNTGCGALRLYAGTTVLQPSSRLYEGNSNSSGTRCYLAVNQNAVLDFNGVSAQSNGLQGSGMVTNSSETVCKLTCKWSPAGSNYQSYQPVFSGSIGGPLALSFTADGYYRNKYEQTLSGQNSHSGGISASGEIKLIFGNEAAAGLGLISVDNCRIDVTTPCSLSGENALLWNSHTFVGSRNADNGTGVATLNAAAVTLTVSGSTLTIGGLGEATEGSSFTKAGAGTLVIAGDATHTGATAVSAGTLFLKGQQISTDIQVASGATLRLGTDAALSPKTNLAIADGGVVNLQNVHIQEVRTITIGDETYDARGSYGAIGSGAVHQFECFTGSGILKLPGETLILVR